MKTFFYKVGLDSYGYDATGLIEGESAEKLADELYALAVDNADSFGYEQNEETLGDLDTVGRADCSECGGDGCEDCDDTGYDEVSVLSYEMEDYDPDEHNGQILGKDWEGYLPSEYD